MTFKPTFTALVVAGLLSGCAAESPRVQSANVLAPIDGHSVPAGVACEQLGDKTVNQVGGCEGYIPMPALSSEQAAAITALNSKFATEVAEIVNFDFNRDALTPKAIVSIDAQAAWMRRYPQIRFSVFGHTDLVGSEGYNFDLAKRRAEAVVARLISGGVNGDQLDALVSYGKTRPLVNTIRPEEMNRRTVTEVTGYLDKPRLYASVRVYCDWIKTSYLPSYPNCVVEPTVAVQPVAPPPVNVVTQSWNTAIERPSISTSASYSDNGTTKIAASDSQAGNLYTSTSVKTEGNVREITFANGDKYQTDGAGNNAHKVTP